MIQYNKLMKILSIKTSISLAHELLSLVMKSVTLRIEMKILDMIDLRPWTITNYATQFREKARRLPFDSRSVA